MNETFDYLISHCRRTIGLSPLQESFLPAIEWFVSDSNSSRNSGRSYLLAYIFILKAIRTPNLRVYIFDHFAPSMQRERHQMMKMIHSIVFRLATGMSREDSKAFTEAFTYIADNYIMFKGMPEREESIKEGR